MRWFYFRPPAQPHNGRRSRSGPIHVCSGRTRTRLTGPRSSSSVGETRPQRARPASGDMHAPRVRRSSRHQKHNHPAGRHVAPLVLLRPAGGIRHPPHPPTTPPPLLRLRNPDGLPLPLPHNRPPTGPQRGNAHHMHRQRPFQDQPAVADRILRKRVRFPGGDNDGGEIE